MQIYLITRKINSFEQGVSDYGNADRDPGCVISTERFMEKIWGYDSKAEINVVWVYLSNLRKNFCPYRQTYR